MADGAAIAAIVTAASSGLASVLGVWKGSDTAKKVEEAEKTIKQLRLDLDNLADQVREQRMAARSQTGSHPAIREPLPSQPDRETEKRIDTLESWRATIDLGFREYDRWRTEITRKVESAERSAQRMRERWISLTASLSASRGKVPVTLEEVDRGSTG
jgi:chromosome segregation ATPase